MKFLLLSPEVKISETTSRELEPHHLTLSSHHRHLSKPLSLLPFLLKTVPFLIQVFCVFQVNAICFTSLFVVSAFPYYRTLLLWFAVLSEATHASNSIDVVVASKSRSHSPQKHFHQKHFPQKHFHQKYFHQNLRPRPLSADNRLSVTKVFLSHIFWPPQCFLYSFTRILFYLKFFFVSSKAVGSEPAQGKCCLICFAAPTSSF